VDRAAIKSSIRTAWELLRSASRQKHDQFDRVCSVVEYMSTVGIGATSYATSVSRTSRMASNIIYDTIYCAKERFDQRLRDSRPADLTLAAEQESELQQELGMDGDFAWDGLLDFPYLDLDMNN